MIDKLPFLPDEHHYAITSVVGRAAQLDHHIEITVAGLMRQHTATFVLKQFGHDRLLGLLRALTLDSFPDEATALCSILDDIVRLRGERNDIMHWLWGKSDDPSAMKLQSVRPHRDNPEPKTKTAQEIQNIANEMLECTTKLLAYLDLNLRKAGLKPLSEKPWLETLVQQARQERLASQEILDRSDTPLPLRPQQPPVPK